MATEQHEIAGAVSDDFDPIARGEVLGLSDPIPARLRECYEDGEFPVPPVPGLSPA